MRYGDLFTGLGGATIGAIEHGYTPLWGVENDERIAKIASSNFGHDIIVKDILDIDPRELEKVDVLHASPPCTNFSVARGYRTERQAADLAMAKKVIEFVRVMKPQIVTIENVPTYCRSEPCLAMKKQIVDEGYTMQTYNINASIFGVPQSRVRSIVIACRDGINHDINNAYEYHPVGWYSAIEDLLPYLEHSDFAPWQEKAFELYNIDLNTIGCSYMVDGQNSRGGNGPPTMRKAHEPAFTIVASVYKAPVRVWLRYKDVRKLNVRALARLQTFPDAYRFSGQRKIDLMGIGNAVPPLLYERILEGIYY